MAAELAPKPRSIPGQPNQVLAGPATGTAPAPIASRALVQADMPVRLPVIDLYSYATIGGL